MQSSEQNLSRRSMLHVIAGISGLGLGVVHAKCSTPCPNTPKSRQDDFDFLKGEWHIRNRRLVCARRGVWDEFDGQATCWMVLNGVGCVEEIRFPSRNCFVLALRILDIGKGIWNDYWVNARDGLLTIPGQTGHFENGIGTFCESHGDGVSTPRQHVRSVWNRTGQHTCSWRQEVSWDDGITWKTNWTMERKRTQTA